MLEELIKGKRVLFITTKNIDYIRNAQEIRILNTHSDKVNLLYSSKKNYPKRLLDIYFKLITASFQRLFHKGLLYDNDIVFVGFAPQLIVPIFRKAFGHKKIVIDFFISVYDTMVCDRKKFNQNSLFASLCHYVDRITLRNIDCIITDTKAQADFFVEEFGADKENVETLYLEADKSIYYPRPQQKPAELKDKFVVLYFGSILPLQGVDVVLSAIHDLKEETGIFFDIIGPIPKSLDKPIQENVKYTNWLPQEQLADRIAEADLCLAGHFNGTIEKANRTIPGKAYIYEAMGKWMILGDSIANNELFTRNSSHCFVSLGSKDSLVIEIMHSFHNWYAYNNSNLIKSS